MSKMMDNSPQAIEERSFQEAKDWTIEEIQEQISFKKRAVETIQAQVYGYERALLVREVSSILDDGKEVENG